jgi:hypothetical protein
MTKQLRSVSYHIGDIDKQHSKRRFAPTRKDVTRRVGRERRRHLVCATWHVMAVCLKDRHYYCQPSTLVARVDACSMTHAKCNAPTELLHHAPGSALDAVPRYYGQPARQSHSESAAHIQRRKHHGAFLRIFFNVLTRVAVALFVQGHLVARWLHLAPFLDKIPTCLPSGQLSSVFCNDWFAWAQHRVARAHRKMRDISE